MNLDQLRMWAADHGQPAFRGAQLYEWLYLHRNIDPDNMENLPKPMRVAMKQDAILSMAKITSISATSGGDTKKYLLELSDGEFVEAVSMIEGGRHTLCLSSQVGCNLKCTFCATASMGFKRNLATGEIVDQFIEVERHADLPVTNVVFMGMGEPFLNYDNVIGAAHIFHDAKGMNLGSRRITLSTAGVVPKIKQFTQEKQPYRLAISLNGVTDDQRQQIMPHNQNWPIKDLLSAAKIYASQPRKMVTFEYVLLEGVNDDPAAARSLVDMLRGMSCKVNVIPYNEIGGEYRRPESVKITAFLNALERGDFPVMVRWSNGSDIDAGCGQLAVRNGA